jgi:hypothetical protein
MGGLERVVLDLSVKPGDSDFRTSEKAFKSDNWLHYAVPHLQFPCVGLLIGNEA